MEAIVMKCSLTQGRVRGVLLVSFAVVAIGISGAAWAQPYVVVGSDTLNGPIKAAITASGASLSYQNLGSSPAEAAMIAGTQSIGPMSRNFRESTLIAHPAWTPAVKNVIGLDAVVVVVKNGQQRCKNLSLGTDPNDPKSAQENNLLQLVLGGVGGEGTTLACADPARLQAVVDFTNCFVGLDRVEHFYRPDDRSGTAEVIKQKLRIKRFCSGAAPGPTNLDAADNDPIRYPCVPADDTRAVTRCSDPYGNLCTAGTEGCTQGLVVALSDADPNTSDVTVSLSRRVKNDSASVAFAGRQAVKQPQSPTNGVNINTISYAPQNIRLDQYMFSRRLYLMKADPSSDPDRNPQEELFYDWATNPDNEVPGRCNMDPLMIQYGYVPCTDDCSPPTGANTLCVKTPFQPAPEPVAACVLDWYGCVQGVDTCCSGLCNEYGNCSSAPPRAEGFACSDSSQCASPLSCLQGDWPVTTCGLAPGGISGTIRLNGIGLENVQVGANQMYGMPYFATADGFGNYAIAGLANGEYTVTPSLYGYTFDPTQAIVTVQNGIVTGVDFTAIIVPMYEISGTVTQGGIGYANAAGHISGPQTAYLTTDSSGHYRAMMPNGDYTIQLMVPYGYLVNPASRTVTVNGADVPGQDFALTAVPQYTISGIITLSGSGMEGVNVNAAGALWSAWATTGPDGRYEMYAFEDEYIVTAELSGYDFSPVSRSVSLHSNASGVDFTATIIARYNISGTVTFDGAGLENVYVELKDAGGTILGSAATGSSGGFTFTDVREGAYTITGSLCGYSITPRPVTVSGGNVTGLLMTAAAAPNYTVSGTVTSNGVGVPYIQIMLLKPDGSGFGTSTQIDGSYSRDCMVPETYTVTPSSNPAMGQNYSFSPPSAEVTLTEANPSATQDFTATPL
jgi:hypothetical protein